MSDIRKQSIYSFIFIYVGFLIGALNTLVLFPKFLSTEQFGLTNGFRDFSTLFATIFAFGSVTTFYKFFPGYNDHLGREKNDFPFLILIVTLIGIALFTICAFLFKDLFSHKFGTNSQLFVDHYLLTIPYTITLLLTNLLESYAFMLKRTSSSNFVKETFFRIYQTICLALYIFDIINIETFFRLFVLMYVPTIIALCFIVFRNQGIKINCYISDYTKSIKKSLSSFTLFHFSGTVITILPNTLNGLMIASLTTQGLSGSAVYGICTALVALLEIPQRGMNGISIATISESWHKNDLSKIDHLYKKTSLTLLIVSICLFGFIFPNTPNMVSFMGEAYAAMVSIVAIKAIGKIFEMSMGMNIHILGLSKKWKVEFYISNATILLSMAINYVLIKNYGIIGAALGDTIMLFLLCSLRYIYLKKLFNLQPYTINTLKVVLIGAIALGITWFIPIHIQLYVDVILKAALFGVLFIPSILLLKISPDMNDLVQKMAGKFIKK